MQQEVSSGLQECMIVIEHEGLIDTLLLHRVNLTNKMSEEEAH